MKELEQAIEAIIKRYKLTDFNNSMRDDIIEAVKKWLKKKI